MSEMQTTQHTGWIPPTTLSWRLQMSLHGANVTRKEMADYLGYSESTISRWTNDHAGKNEPPKAAIINQWALRTGVPVEWLRDGTEPQNGPDSGGDLRIRPTGRKVDTALALVA